MEILFCLHLFLFNGQLQGTHCEFKTLEECNHAAMAAIQRPEIAAVACDFRKFDI